eukprot:CAMPEP_0197048118 /NCGR_PEP_ID=MMETSP1384-20130603/23535_1 /TAXON_ID=29189 /ORGANISM="Ammonia sp." /LENGTH=205 /DNA_ID=CAMNT_0042480195 /DNA_START=1 /DNA_END=615 /DNA_ORIENTATION=+
MGGQQSLKIQSIINIISCENYKVYLSAIYYFQHLIIGQIPDSQKQLTKSTITAFNNLIMNEIKRDEEDEKEDKTLVPQYISNLFHRITLMTNHKITFKIDEIAKYFDNSIKDLFISQDNCWLKLDVVVSLFPNVKKIWIENLIINETTIVQLYTFCEKISNNSKGIKYKSVQLDEVCIVNASVKIDVNDKNYINQIKQPFDQTEW